MTRDAGIVRFVAALMACACSAGSDGSPATPITPTPAATVILLSADSVAATALAGDKPVAQDVQISSGTTAVLQGLAIGQVIVVPAIPSGAVSASVSATSAPATLSVRFDPGALVPGAYVATIPITATGAAAKSLQARLIVRPHPMLLVDRSSFAIEAQAGDSVPPVTVHVTSSSDTIGQLTLGAPTCATQGGWLTPSLVGNGTPSVVSLSVASRGLAAGHYTCRVTVATNQALVDSASRPIDISIDVHQAPRIVVSTLDIHGSAIAGDETDLGTLSVTNGGNGVLDQLAVATDYVPGTIPGWLRATLDTSVAPAKLTLGGSAAKLSPGAYSATVRVSSTASGVVNSPQTIAVAFTVFPQPPKPFVFVISPSAVSFTMKHNGQFPPAQGVALFDGNGGSSTIKNVSSTGDYIPWATSSLNGNVPSSGVFEIGGYLGVGSYSETLTITLANGAIATLTINLTVTP